jgi:hypothetical protein
VQRKLKAGFDATKTVSHYGEIIGDFLTVIDGWEFSTGEMGNFHPALT